MILDSWPSSTATAEQGIIRAHPGSRGQRGFPVRLVGGDHCGAGLGGDVRVHTRHTASAMPHDSVAQNLRGPAVRQAGLPAVAAGMRRSARQDRKPACLGQALRVPATDRDSWPQHGSDRHGPGRLRTARRIPAGCRGRKDPRSIARSGLVHAPAGVLLALAWQLPWQAQEDVTGSLAGRHAGTALAAARPALSSGQVRGEQVPQKRRDVDGAP